MYNHQLETFIRVADEGSFNKGGRGKLYHSKDRLQITDLYGEKLLHEKSCGGFSFFTKDALDLNYTLSFTMKMSRFLFEPLGSYK